MKRTGTPTNMPVARASSQGVIPATPPLTPMSTITTLYELKKRASADAAKAQAVAVESEVPQVTATGRLLLISCDRALIVVYH